MGRDEKRAPLKTPAWEANIAVALTVVQHQCGSTDDGLLLCAVTLSGEQRRTKAHFTSNVLRGLA